MDDRRLLTVQECQSAGHVEDELPDLRLWHLSNLVSDRAVGTIGHHQVRTVVVDIKMVDVEQIGMAQLVGHLELVAELLESLGVQRAIELDGHIDVCQQVMCQPYIAETALSELTLEFIVLGYDTSFFECHSYRLFYLT